MASSTTIGSLALGIQIIDVVAKSDSPLKFSDIQEATGISKSNLYKYLNTLTQMNLLYRDQKRGAYSLGYKFLEYGVAATQNANFIDRLTPYFKEISQLTQMTTLLSLWVNDAPIITNIWNTNYGLSIGAQVGSKMPLKSAIGTTFAAFAHSEEYATWIEQEQQQPGFDVAKFQRTLKQIRQDGFSFAHESLAKHVTSLAFPILNFNHEIVGVFAVVGFEEDVPSSKDAPMIQQILALNAEMNAIFGYTKEEQ